MSTKYYIHTQNKEFVEKYFFNEYRLVDEPCFGYEICIGRRSGGWKPLFNQHNDAYTSVEEMKEIRKKTIEKEKADANHLSKIKLLLAIFVLFVLLSVWLFYSLIR